MALYHSIALSWDNELYKHKDVWGKVQPTRQSPNNKMKKDKRGGGGTVQP